MDPFTSVVSFIKDVGFPIGVAIYSLVRLESTVKANTTLMQAIAVKLGVPVGGANNGN